MNGIKKLQQKLKLKPRTGSKELTKIEEQQEKEDIFEEEVNLPAEGS